MDGKTHVVIVGGGFTGLAAAKGLGGAGDISVTLIDRRNHYLFQPLLYQVAMAGLSRAEIAAPIRGILSRQRNVRVLQGEVRSVDFTSQQVEADFGRVDYDYLILACGASHSYLGKPEWEQFAPGLKTLEQATEIRRRVLTAFEMAERETDSKARKKLLTFVVIGGGPTGVELAGAIGEMSRFTLARDFRSIDASLARVILIEGGPRILPMFADELSSKATRDLEHLGVQVWTSSIVTDVNGDGIAVGDEKIQAATVLWAAGVKASSLGTTLGLPTDRLGRVVVRADLSQEEYPNVFVGGTRLTLNSQEYRFPALRQWRCSRDGYWPQTFCVICVGSRGSSFSTPTKAKWPRSDAVGPSLRSVAGSLADSSRGWCG